MIARRFYVLTTVLLAFIVCGATVATQTPTIGREMAVPRHLQDGEEFTLSTKALIEHGRTLFTAAWTIEDGGGRPLIKGTGNPLGDTTSPLLFPRNFNRISAPDANSCAGCHNLPFGIPGGGWITSGVQGIAAPSLATSGPKNPPSLVIRPFHQAGNVVSIRQFSNNAFNHHHGIQSTERFGIGTDPDGDGVVNEMTRADVTAAAVFQAAMAVPGRVIPDDPEIEAAVLVGE